MFSTVMPFLLTPNDTRFKNSAPAERIKRKRKIIILQLVRCLLKPDKMVIFAKISEKVKRQLAFKIIID